MTPPRRGRLLVAAPTLDDPNFFRTVVLLLAYDPDGALGVVLNRPSDTPVAEIVPSWALHASTPGLLFAGGPVQPNAAICVGHPEDDSLGAHLDLDLELGMVEQVTLDDGEGRRDDDGFGGYSPLTSMLGTVDLHREPEEIAVQLRGLRVFKGYAGWGAGQLDEELAQDAWFVVEGDPGDVLTAEPETLWERVLRRQGGWLSVLSRHPVDPSLN